MNNKKEILIDSAVSGLSALLSASNPVLGIAGCALAPMIANAAKSMLPQVMGERENKKLELVFTRTIEKINVLLTQGKTPRDDETYYGDTYLGIPKAQELLEGVLLKAREEYQSKKLECYSSFFANLCFDETISFEHANYLLNMIQKLSYRQLCILTFLSDGRTISTSRWDAVFKSVQNDALGRYFDFYSEYIDLYNGRMIVQTTNIPGFAVGMSDTNISSLGLSIVRLLDLKDIPSEDIENIGHYVSAIDSIINHG